MQVWDQVFSFNREYYTDVSKEKSPKDEMESVCYSATIGSVWY